LFGPVSHETHPDSSRNEAGGSARAHTIEINVTSQDSGDVIAELERLDGLRKSGAITEEEFERLKRRAIDSSV
ncbi:MAG: hypothetical protein EXQ98_07140, partial [Alphaproteobacteria bacterium]|nr:hypothetical protein [Alphaproteobacteria bacterium]